MKKLIILLVLPLFFGFKTGSEIDEKKMNRDLEIAKNILGTLINSNSGSWFGSASIEAAYIKDYGVVFTIPEQLVYFHGGGSVIAIPDIPPVPPIPDIDIDFEHELDEAEKEALKQEMKLQKEIMKEKQKEMKKQQYEVQKQLEEIEVRKEDIARARAETKAALAEAHELDRLYVSTGGKSDVDWEEVMVTFMTDYADLIGQLKSDEKIVIKQKAPYNDLVFIWSDGKTDEKIENQRGSLSAEVLRKDVAAYKSGKINKKEFISRIDIIKAKAPKKVPDLEMFANIFDRFYSHDLTETFYSQGKPSYEVLDGYGAVFYIKAATGNSRSSSRYRYRSSGVQVYATTPDSDEESEDEALYPKFKEDLKAFILDYGRTIRSLGDNEKVMLNIKINSCRGCEVPNSMEVSVKMSTLKQYDQQKLSREKALGQIEIKENS